MIPWSYKNKHYFIDFCYGKLTINNIFENENYAILSSQPEDYHYCGYIYNKNYLCDSDYDNNFITIWDLKKKNVYKRIIYDAIHGSEIIQ